MPREKARGYNLICDGKFLQHFRRKPKKEIRELGKLAGISFDPELPPEKERPRKKTGNLAIF